MEKILAGSLLSRATLIPSAIYIVIWLLLLTWSLGATASVDHDSLLGRIHQLNREKKALESQIHDLERTPKQTNPKGKDGEFAKLMVELEDKQVVINGLRTELARGKEAEPLKITLSDNFIYPDTSKASRAMQLIALTNKVITPVRVIISCKGEIKQWSEVIPGGAILHGGGGRLSEREIQTGIQSPPWTPVDPLVVTLYFDEDEIRPCNLTLP